MSGDSMEDNQYSSSKNPMAGEIEFKNLVLRLGTQ